MQALNAHSTYCDGICQSQSGRNAILTVCFLSILSRGVVTAGRIFLAADGTSHHHQGWKNATATGRGVIANNNYSVVLAQGRSTLSRVLERSTKRPWPCPLC